MMETRYSAWRNRRIRLNVPIFGPEFNEEGDLMNEPQYPLL